MPFRPTAPLGFLPIACLLVGLMSVPAFAGPDPDVDDAMTLLKAVDGLKKDEFARYEEALNKYADMKQRLLTSLGAVLEADEADVDGKWDQLCDGGIRAVDELEKSAPAEKTKLKDFYAREKAVWEVLTKIEVPQAEEAETRVRKMIETISPVVTRSVQEMIDEDRAGDEATTKTWAQIKEASRNLLRVVLQVAVDNKELGDLLDDMLKNPEFYRAAASQAKEETTKKASRLKAFTARVQLAIELYKRVAAADEESMRLLEKGRASLANIQHSKAVVAHAGRWIKVVESHYATTKDAMKKYQEVVTGKLDGKPDNDTKAKLGDADFYKEQIAQLEADTKAIEDGLNQFERRINEYRDGEFKNKLKDILAKCRAVTKDVSDIRTTLKNEYESALNDAGLR